MMPAIEARGHILESQARKPYTLGSRCLCIEHVSLRVQGLSGIRVYTPGFRIHGVG